MEADPAFLTAVSRWLVLVWNTCQGAATACFFLSPPLWRSNKGNAGTDLGFKHHVCNGDPGLSQEKTGHLYAC